MDQDTVNCEAPQLILRALTAVIERSPIRVREARSRLPAGFDAVDIAVLDWIAAQARRARPRYFVM
jgi:hypothetical protein